MQRNSTLTRKVGLKAKQGLKRPTTTLKAKPSSVKKKPRSTSKLHDDIWELCRLILRKTQPNVCYTCGATGLQGSNWQTGHGPLPKAVLGLKYKYDFDILRSQCLNCNKHRGGMGAVFLEKWLKEKGWKMKDYQKWKIEAVKTNFGSRETHIFLEEQIALYKQKLHELHRTD